MNKKYDFGIVIGRFQPFHVAHRELIKHSLTLAEKVIVILGSARSASDVRNPFTPAMREEIIRACFPEDSARLIFCAVRDYPYNDHVWTAEVQNVVSEISDETDGAKIAIVGFFKDRSSYYLNLFPQWNFEEFYVSDKKLLNINATMIREKFFTDDASWKEFLPAQVAVTLEVFKQTETFPHLQKEFAYLQKYKADTRFVGVPFEPTFITTDAVVVQSGHVLVIRRGHQPGKGSARASGRIFGKRRDARRQRDQGIKGRNTDQSSRPSPARQHQIVARFRLSRTLAARSHRHFRLFHRTRARPKRRLAARQRRRRRGKSLLAAAVGFVGKRGRVFRGSHFYHQAFFGNVKC